MTATYGLCGKLTTAPRDRDMLVGILTRAADLMAGAAGCQLYIVFRDATDDGAVWVTEVWDTQAAHDDSLSVPGVRELIAQARPLLTGGVEQHVLIPVGGKGL